MWTPMLLWPPSSGHGLWISWSLLASWRFSAETEFSGVHEPCCWKGIDVNNIHRLKRYDSQRHWKWQTKFHSIYCSNKIMFDKTQLFGTQGRHMRLPCTCVTFSLLWFKTITVSGSWYFCLKHNQRNISRSEDIVMLTLHCLYTFIYYRICASLPF